MPAHYRNNNLDFAYPENWSLQEQNPEGEPLQLMLESPQGAQWTLFVYETGDSGESNEETRKRCENEFLESMRQQYDSLEVAPVDDAPLESVSTRGFDAFFYCLDFLVAARFRSFHSGNRLFLLLTQAENRDYDQIEPVFAAITISLLRNLPQGALPGV